MSTLTSFSMPSVIDLSSGNVLFTVSVGATDPEGVDRLVVWFDRDISYTIGTSSSGGTWSLIGLYGYGDAWNDGASSETNSLLSATPSGRVDVMRIDVTDLAGNVTTYDSDALRALGFMTGMDVVGSTPVEVEGAYATVSVDGVIRVREGTSQKIDLSFLNLTRDYFSWEYHTSTAGGTATSADLGATSGSGSVSVYSTTPTSRSQAISISATRDGIQEATETAYLTVKLGGGQTFEDGGSMKVIRIDILDDNLTTGGAGNNVLRGTSAAETLAGGLGNDIYYVTAGDRVQEAAGAGIDTVISTHTRTLEANVEHLTLTGAGNINGIGNALANHIIGNAGRNFLNAGMGNDTLNGGAGADTMNGGGGNDTYIVDNAGDRVNEAVNAGTDVVHASVSHTLGANVENLILTGASGINGIGNALDNRMVGNAGNNFLNGGRGADIMNGGRGNDTYVVDSAGDRVNEAANAGTDMVRASLSHTLGANVENLTLTGTANINGFGNVLANHIIGNAGSNILNGGRGADILNGGGGNDRLIGGAGADRMTGGAGADHFVFQSLTDSTIGAAGRDVVQDFNRTQGDRIDLRLIDADAGLAGNQGFRFIGESALSNAAGEVRYLRAAGVTAITGDVDGDGRADFAINLIGNMTLGAGDFLL